MISRRNLFDSLIKSHDNQRRLAVNFSLGINAPLSEKLAGLIRQKIFRGELKARSRIPKDELAEEFGVSRMPIREALSILSYEGLVILEPRRGAWVAPITVETIDETYCMRQWAESKAVELSVPHLTDQDLENARKRLIRLEEAEASGDTAAFVDINSEFHQLLRSRCPWPKLLALVDTLWNGFPPLTPQFVAGQMAHDRSEHRAMLKTAMNRQAKEAADIMTLHIERSWKSTRDHFQSLGWSGEPVDRNSE